MKPFTYISSDTHSQQETTLVIVSTRVSTENFLLRNWFEMIIAKPTANDVEKEKYKSRPQNRQTFEFSPLPSYNVNWRLCQFMCELNLSPSSRCLLL